MTLLWQVTFLLIKSRAEYVTSRVGLGRKIKCAFHFLSRYEINKFNAHMSFVGFSTETQIGHVRIYFVKGNLCAFPKGICLHLEYWPLKFLSL